jgi:CheY-like chemotaxis protein
MTKRKYPLLRGTACAVGVVMAKFMAEHAVILLAEDEEDYVLLIRRAFAQAKIPNPLHVVWNGQEAIAYLKGEGKYANREEYPLPDLFLLDLKMPRVNGFEVLKWLRSEPGLAPLRVLVLTSSEELRDVNEAYKLGANSFLVKPLDFQDFTQLSRLIQEFWLKASKTPETFRPPKNPGDAASQSGSEQPTNGGRKDR